MPYKIGCGFAGGDWTKYGDALAEFEEKYDADVNLYKSDILLEIFVTYSLQT